MASRSLTGSHLPPWRHPERKRSPRRCLHLQRLRYDPILCCLTCADIARRYMHPLSTSARPSTRLTTSRETSSRTSMHATFGPFRRSRMRTPASTMFLCMVCSRPCGTVLSSCCSRFSLGLILRLVALTPVFFQAQSTPMILTPSTSPVCLAPSYWLIYPLHSTVHMHR